MKTILVLTDFSENALRAAETAAMLSGPFSHQRSITNIIIGKKTLTRYIF